MKDWKKRERKEFPELLFSPLPKLFYDTVTHAKGDSIICSVHKSNVCIFKCLVMFHIQEVSVVHVYNSKHILQNSSLFQVSNNFIF